MDGPFIPRTSYPTRQGVFNIYLLSFLYLTGPKSMPLSGHFQWLDPGINLTIPPNNWLRAGSPLEKYVHQALYTGTRIPRSHMSSIDMATDHLDMVDDIDVISDAKVCSVSCYGYPGDNSLFGRCLAQNRNIPG